MKFEDARQVIKNEWKEIVRQLVSPAAKNVNGEQSYICPFCAHGTHGDGLTFIPGSKDNNTLKCFACGFSGDIIALYEKMKGINHREAVKDLAKMINIKIDDNATEQNNTTGNRTKAFSSESNITTYQEEKQSENETERPQAKKHTEYYKKCAKNIEFAAEYLEKRGISLETAKKYGLGFDEFSDPAESGYKMPRLIIPVNDFFYIGRSTDDSTAKQYKKMNNKGAIVDIYNKKALYAQNVQEVFVVEGAIDALSIIEVGFTAVALNSTSLVTRFIEDLKTAPTKATLIVCLDNDPAGVKASEELRQGLQRLNISFITANICGNKKDANEALTENRSEFISALKEAKNAASSRPDKISHYINKMLFQRDIENFKDIKTTGFENLDKQSGGLYPGLYCIAAISSLGKTTLAHQIADNLAISGKEVLFFSLEQSKFELASKSISRTMAKANKKTALTSLQIRRGEKLTEATAAALYYSQLVGDRISIIEGNFNCDINFIAEYVRKYIRKTDTKPVVFIDYLQILQPSTEDKKKTVKDSIDSSITELKRISRELNITIFVISSVNRANYLTPIDFESLKESGGIEYTCDVIWGLQLECLNESIFEKTTNIKERHERIKDAKSENPRKIELVCLKNRYGISNFTCKFNYYPHVDLFEPEEAEKIIRRI